MEICIKNNTGLIQIWNGEENGKKDKEADRT